MPKNIGNNSRKEFSKEEKTQKLIANTTICIKLFQKKRSNLREKWTQMMCNKKTTFRGTITFIFIETRHLGTTRRNLILEDNSRGQMLRSGFREKRNIHGNRNFGNW